jgi:hypothetical protein
MHGAGILVPLFALSIPVVAIFARMMKRFFDFKERQLELIGRDSAERAAQYASHVERLEQRVRVLERIVTDKGLDLHDQIERLRDDRTRLPAGDVE